MKETHLWVNLSFEGFDPFIPPGYLYSKGMDLFSGISNSAPPWEEKQRRPKAALLGISIAECPSCGKRHVALSCSGVSPVSLPGAPEVVIHSGSRGSLRGGKRFPWDADTPDTPDTLDTPDTPDTPDIPAKSWVALTSWAGFVNAVITWAPVIRWLSEWSGGGEELLPPGVRGEDVFYNGNCMNGCNSVQKAAFPGKGNACPLPVWSVEVVCPECRQQVEENPGKGTGAPCSLN